MANASVEKLKALGIRHGEKAVMALTAALCVFLMYKAVTLETIDLTPEQVRQAAQAADTNLNRTQPPGDILKLLEDSGIKNPNFVTMVEQQQKNLLVADNFRAHQLWVTPEPGAGVIRDKIELVPPTELYAYPGRGGALVFELDENGNRIPDPDAGKKLDDATTARRQRRAAGPKAALARARAARKKEEEKKRLAIEEARKKAAIVGGPAVAKAEATQESQGPEKEKTQGLRWVAITGVLDYKTLRENYLNALKRPEVAYPHFKQLDIERQVKQADGSWSDWEAVDLDRNRLILDNLPEEDEEFTPENVRLSALVAPLPFLKAGYWERVHVGRMVSKEKLEVLAAPAAGEGGEMMPGAAEAMPNEMRRPESAVRPTDAMPGGEGSPGGTAESTDFEKTEVDEVMVRALDFTVEPDVTYRFRLRVVVYNPNIRREDIVPGVDNTSLDLAGPWSEPTDEVTVPPDVAPYALDKEIPVPKKLDQVRFEVACWTADDGVTVVKIFPAAPGDIIGRFDQSYIPVPDSSGKKPQTRQVDFNSKQVVLDVTGGNLLLPSIGAGGGRFDIPAQSLVMRPDGAVVVRSQAVDVPDQIRKDISENYHRAISDIEAKAKKKRR